MNIKTKIVLALTGIQSLILAYLTKHYYDIDLGKGSDSFCNISSFMNCSNVSASEYSNIMGVPIALIGFFITLIIGFCFFQARKPENKTWHGFGWLLAAAFTLGNLALFAVSMFVIKSLCILCLGAYLITLAILIIMAKPPKDFCMGDLIKPNSGLVFLFVLLVSAVGLAFGTNTIYRQSGQPKGYDKIIKAALWDWKNAPQITFDQEPWLRLGSPDAKYTLVEFADYTCGHCGEASKMLTKFLKAHKNLKVDFYAFPLDGTCNPLIPSKRGGVTCLMAKAAYCGNKASDAKLHKLLFEKQAKLRGSYDKAKETIEGLAKGLNLDWQALSKCIDAKETHSKLLEQAKLGKKMNIRGTPTMFLEGRKLIRGQDAYILRKALNSL